MNAVQEDARIKCICRDCPSFKDCGELIAYCVIKKSTCITEQKGCECPRCLVYTEQKLSKLYYCINGPKKKWGLF